MLCHSLGEQSSNNVSWDIQTPANLVPGTDQTFLTLNSDLLGNTIEVPIITNIFFCNEEVFFCCLF